MVQFLGAFVRGANELGSTRRSAPMPFHKPNPQAIETLRRHTLDSCETPPQIRPGLNQSWDLRQHLRRKPVCHRDDSSPRRNAGTSSYLPCYLPCWPPFTSQSANPAKHVRGRSARSWPSRSVLSEICQSAAGRLDQVALHRQRTRSVRSRNSRPRRS